MTGGSRSMIGVSSSRRLAAVLAALTASPSSSVWSTARTTSGRLNLSRNREAGKKSASWAQPRLTCQPIRSSPPGDAM